MPTSSHSSLLGVVADGSLTKVVAKRRKRQEKQNLRRKCCCRLYTFHVPLCFIRITVPELMTIAPARVMTPVEGRGKGKSDMSAISTPLRAKKRNFTRTGEEDGVPEIVVVVGEDLGGCVERV
jgi:hypothetical protein